MHRKKNGIDTEGELEKYRRNRHIQIEKETEGKKKYGTERVKERKKEEQRERKRKKEIKRERERKKERERKRVKTREIK